MKSISKERVGALSDGVIAIAVTILVLELKVPEDHSLSRDDVEHWVLLFLGWVVSFIMIAVMWLENHRQLVLASVWTMPLMIVTFAQLGLISLIPFGSNLIMDQPDSLASAITFNVIMFANGLCAGAGGLVLARDLRMQDEPEVAATLVRRSLLQVLVYASIAVIGLLGAILHHPFLGVILWLSMPLVAWFWLSGAEKSASSRAHGRTAKGNS
ncbi:TMEM175 family protein [Roseicyclus mahoneyensis]|uniref:Putative membrane protein n=1 Tax=Roseicyclus mahoneyensis TaxID=164332 RepID=A0A316GIK4_9RHOB|nr:TMEM175 family protein [Roseicyclus mahoneyensis]PWK59220.1 putative membrane protein [Roseicyclus mahoneyensis]